MFLGWVCMIRSQSQIIGRDHFPTLMQAYSYVQGEESWRSVMIHVPYWDRSALVTTTRNEIKVEKSRGGWDDLMQNRVSANVSTVENLGTLDENIRSYTVALPNNVVVAEGSEGPYQSYGT